MLDEATLPVRVKRSENAGVWYQRKFRASRELLGVASNSLVQVIYYFVVEVSPNYGP